MAVLIDTGILLRLLDRNDSQHTLIRQAIRQLRTQGETLVVTPQNAAEFWNVCTRPASARGGFGLTVQEADRRLRLIERLFPVLQESPAAYPLWRQLVVSHGVMGVQVHDAWLVAAMRAHGINNLLTLNAPDFIRYPGITVLTPQDVVAVPGPP